MLIYLELINFVRNEYLRLFDNNANIYPIPLIESYYLISYFLIVYSNTFF